jgi:hypothetical protein
MYSSHHLKPGNLPVGALKRPPMSDSKVAVLVYRYGLLQIGPFWSRVPYLVSGFGPGGRFLGNGHFD